MPLLMGGHAPGEQVENKILVAYAGVNSHGHHLWLWRGDCCDAVQGPSTLSHLRRGRRCLPCSYLRENNGRWTGYRDLTGVWLTQVRVDAASRGHAWEVTPEQIWAQWERQQGRCRYTGRRLTHGVDASLDRRDNVRGYLPDNIQWVHRDINRMKSVFAEDLFLQLCAEVADRL